VFDALFRLLLRSSSTTEAPQRKQNAKIAKMLQRWVAEKRYCLSDVCLADVADEFGVSTESLSYFFATVIRERFTTFRKCLRLQEAKRIISVEPDCKLVLVATRVGIPDKCNFRKQFHELFGYSPSVWKQMCANGGKTEIAK